MKKFLVSILIVVLCLSSIYANNVSSNLQKIYDVNSQVYEAISYLYIAEGKALPSTSGPWSGSELNLMLSRIDKNELTGYELEIYEYANSIINENSQRFVVDNNFAFSISGDLGIRATYHTNPNDFNSPDDVANSGTNDWKKQLPIIAIPLETWFGNNIYGFSSFDLGINRTLVSADVGNGTNTKGFGFQTNIIMIPPVLLSDLNMNFPNRAFGSIGGDWYSFEIGRDNLSWGAGESGNLTLGNQLPYHNQARFTAFSDAFKYTFLMSFFPHPKNYVETEGKAPHYDYDKNDGSQTTTEIDWINNHFNMRDSRDGITAFIGHRLEWRIADKLGMALNETIMYQNANNFDPIVLSPTAVFHNYYIRRNANSLLSLEIDYSPISNINIYGQFAIDEFKLPGEFSLAGPPSAFGLLLGTKGAIALNSGMLYGSIEGAYTEPYLYIRDDGASYDPYKYGINYIGAIPEFVPAEELSNYALKPIGYRYGNDTVVANINIGYKSFGKWFVEGTMRYLLDGCMDIFTRWNNDVIPNSDNDPNAPTTKHPDEGNYVKGSNWAERNAIAKNLALTLKGGITITNNFDVVAEATYITINNFQNIKGKKTSDFQLEVSAKYSF